MIRRFLLRRFLHGLVILFLALSAPALLKAQDVASITGSITDPTGAVVPGVNVTLQNPQTGAVYKAVSNSEGSYTINQIKPGPGYKLEFSRDGFNSFIVSGLYLNVDATRTQNARLSLGAAQQTVEISASNQTVTLDTTDATVGNNFQVEYLNQLPVQNRDSPSALFYQQPGVTLSGAVAGARTDQSNVTLDGLEVNDNATGQFGAIVGNAPVDSVQEFRGTTAGMLASAGQGGGGQFELVTKSGSNHFHGSVNEYHRETAFEANDWFNNNAGVSRPPLVRNQFGGNIGGPILKDKLFFFFDYDGRRDSRSELEDRTVPLDSYRSGNVSYLNSDGGISTLNSQQVAGLDPLGIGFNSGLLSLWNSRYPHANDLSGDVGDLVNTAGFRFNAPNPYNENDFVQRVDYNLNSRMKIFGRGTVTRINTIWGANQFADDTITYPESNRSYAWVAGHTWSIGNNKINQATGGITYEDLSYPVAYNPQGINEYGYAGLSGPYGSGSNAQARTYPIPVVRDDFSWEKGKHSLTFGGSFKWETPNEFAAENYNFPNVGVTGNTNFTALAPNLRPDDIYNSTSATSIYDNAYSTALGAFASVSSNFNYNAQSQVQPQGSGLALKYRYYETEIYFSDAWKVTPSFTLTYGLRYQNYTVPYEVHGDQAIANLDFDTYFADRNAQSAAGIEGDSALPFYTYTLGGKVNHAPSYFQPNNKNFAPRFGFSYQPDFDKKTVFHGSAGIVYDHSIVNALQFQQTQASYLFEASNVNLYGTAGDPTSTLMTAPRFASISAAPAAPAAPNVKPPYTPFVEDGTPIGLPEGQFNLLIDKKLKTPYSIDYTFGMQHEFPQGYILKVDYAAKLGRRLLATADASQLIDFPDNSKKSNQSMGQAMGAMTTQLRQNANLGTLNDILSLSPQPWFENVVAPGVGAANGFANNTQLIAYEAYPYPNYGDFADTMYVLAAIGILPSNVGMASQFAANDTWTNKGFSDYNAMLVTLHKNVGYGLQFDLNYTWAHSIDNVSIIANSLAGNNGYGFICDVNRPRECRGNSDFDVANYINGNFVYELPFGRNKMFAGTVPFWLNEIVGGWTLSGLPSWHTGVAYNATSNAYVTGFANDAPATLIGSTGNLKAKTTGGNGAPLNAFSNSSAALGSFTGPTGFSIGSRNNLRGPGYFNLDMGLSKSFQITPESMKFILRADAFNSLNHPNFSNPSAVDITQSNGVPFGTISSTVIPPGSDLAPRVLQVSGRIEF